MTIYEHRTSLPTASGTVSSVTLPIRGGLCRLIWVEAATDTTVFRARLLDSGSDAIIDYGFHTGSLRDSGIAIPVAGPHILQITNAAPDDTFKIKIRVEE